jgi:DNA-binding PadR family transcriptional regulator
MGRIEGGAEHGAILTAGPACRKLEGSRNRAEATDGALGSHLQKLEEIDYIRCQKAFVGRKPRSTYSITSAGRRALLKYLDTLQAIVQLVQKDSANS